MLMTKILIVLITVSSCLAAPEPEPKPDAEFDMSFHFRDAGDSGGGSVKDDMCGHDDPAAMCVMSQPYWGDCPPKMHFSPGSCHYPDKKICCKNNPICGNDAQGQCYRTNVTTDKCPLPLFSQSTRHSTPCPDHETTCCAEHPDPHCHCDHWGYEGMCDTRGWEGLCPDFCSYDRQSPINIDLDDVIPKPIVNWNFTNYNKAFTNINCENNGHFIACHFDLATIKPKVSGDGVEGEYMFEHMEFHIGCEDGMGSEHTIDDMSYCGELHLIHFNSKYANYSMALHSNDPAAIAVLGIFLYVNETQHPAIYDPFMENLVYIAKRYEEVTFSFNHPLEAFLPSKLDPFYRYNGSLTHPSCNEVVVWTIFKEPAIIGNYQIRPFRCMMEGHGHHMCDNHRPTQPLNGRNVYKYE